MAIEVATEMVIEVIGATAGAVVGVVEEAVGVVLRGVEEEVAISGVAVEMKETIGAAEEAVLLADPAGEAAEEVAVATIKAADGIKLRLLPGSKALLPERNPLPHLLLPLLRPVVPGSENPLISWRWPEEATAAARHKESLLLSPTETAPISGTEEEVMAEDRRLGGGRHHLHLGLTIL